jgi:hypothetical protein
VLRDGEVQFDGTVRALMRSRDPWIVTSLSGWIPELMLDPLTPGPGPGPHVNA